MGGGLATIDDLLARACAESVVPGVVAMVADWEGLIEQGVYAELGAATPA